LHNNKIEKEIASLKESLKEILYFKGQENNIDFFISSLTEFNPLNSTQEVEEWLTTINKTQYFSVDKIPLNKLKNWSTDKQTGDLVHDSGGFFSIRGLNVKTNWGKISSWSQPIIYQPEIGILGIITKKINGILYFLLQAKAEPGNINTYQLSPTVQATRSNYLQLHGGKKTEYLEYFINNNKVEILIDQLQSEQGARFYQKRNRNIIIRIPNNYDLTIHKNHRWLTMGQILKLAQKDNTVNMDTRSVISSVSYEPERVISKKTINEKKLNTALNNFALSNKSKINYASKLMVSSHSNTVGFNSTQEILNKISKRKFESELKTEIIPLNKIDKWIQSEDEIFHPERKFFSVIGVHIEAMNREVSSWDQPIIKQDHRGLIGFITKEINGVIHFLTQLKLECGVMDLLEVSPTVQCITSNYNNNNLPLYVDELIKRKNFDIISDVFQSEEGGRFFQESNQNIILKADDSFETNLNHNFIWMTLGQLKQFIKFNNFLNIEARSLLSCLEIA
jgi:dTDP-4-dehydro-6-deoxy-alpha-D-glucopyranose 2,3-dehydratase